ncbi:UDP-N-acetylmuramoyl-L-alanine--D-glutamate ligase [Aquiluna sp.]|nr:UDP-N-acetylmuramoyl-L-alanine--D-glutamate ligase [Aquiluna sp.]
MSLPTSWHEDWSQLKAVVLGLGKSGFSALDTLVELGVEALAVGEAADERLVDLAEVIGSKFIFDDSPKVLDELGFTPDFAVVSPGFAPSHPLVQELESRKVQLITDIDLAYRLRDKTPRVAKWIVVTGTNGKTTTCELTAAMLAADAHRAVACGNIGNPILDAIRDPEGFDFLVVELSSFQLHYLGEIHPFASAFLNLAEDHLDWHGDMQSYFEAKSKIYLGTEVAIVFNEQDPKTLEAAQQADVLEGCRAIAFSLFTPQKSAVGFVEEILVDRAFLANRAEEALEIATESELSQIGPVSDQLRANVAAATALARAAAVPPQSIRRAITTFKLSPHRNQLVAEIGGVLFVNDSKATNAHAANSSLSAYDSVVWIVGGLFKGVDPAELIKKHGTRLRAAVLIGSETEQLAKLFSELLPDTAISVISGDSVMRDAVLAAQTLAEPGDTVLLAPAAASMDQFRDYAHRGESFVRAVGELSA